MKKLLIYKYPFWQRYPKFILDSVLMLNFLMFGLLGVTAVIAVLALGVYRLSGLSFPGADNFINSLDGTHYLGGLVAVILGFVLLKECVHKFKDWFLPFETVSGIVTAVKEEYTADSESGTDSWFVYIGERSWKIPDRLAGKIFTGNNVEIHATAYYKEVRCIYLILK